MPKKSLSSFERGAYDYGGKGFFPGRQNDFGTVQKLLNS